MIPPVYIGVDPGQSGAIAAVTARELTGRGRLVWVEDMPDPLSGALIAELLDGEEVDTAVVEQVSAMPRQGVSSTFKFGKNYGIVLGALGALRIPIVHVTPAVWKRTMGVKADKDTARRMACDLWPASADLFARKKDDGRAEAALIALWLMQQRQGRGVAA
jgi:crossover junction endodeoxyribonuclease RuvC